MGREGIHKIVYTACVAVFYRGSRGPPYTVGLAEPFGSSRYESNLYIVKPPLDPLLNVFTQRLQSQIMQLSCVNLSIDWDVGSICNKKTFRLASIHDQAIYIYKKVSKKYSYEGWKWLTSHPQNWVRSKFYRANYFEKNWWEFVVANEGRRTEYTAFQN